MTTRVLAWSEIIALPLIWGGGLFGALQLQNVATGSEHSICGPWGCGPDTGALLTMHVGWLAVLGPPLLYMPFRVHLSSLWIDRLASTLIGIGLLGMASIIGYQWLVWLPQAGEWSRDYIWQRCGFQLATAVDFPLAQLTLLGIILTLMNRWRSGDSRRVASNQTNPGCVLTDVNA